jgi:hypothetical protein
LLPGLQEEENGNLSNKLLETFMSFIKVKRDTEGEPENFAYQIL